ncbi:hypothetical protein KW537_21845 [Vibrio fluvialis]|nr:hypothetical protein [Vibrio fluvialis]
MSNIENENYELEGFLAELRTKQIKLESEKEAIDSELGQTVNEIQSLEQRIAYNEQLIADREEESFYEEDEEEEDELDSLQDIFNTESEEDADEQAFDYIQKMSERSDD